MQASRTHSRSFAKSFSATRLFLRRQLWIWPIVAGTVLGIVGWFLRSQVEGALKTTMAENLQTILDADVAGLRIWLKTQQNDAASIAETAEVRKLVSRLVERAADKNTDTTALIGSPELKQLRRELKPWLSTHHHNGFVVMDRRRRVIASLTDDLIGKQELSVQQGLIETLLRGKAVVTRPTKSRVLLKDQGGRLRAEVPTMFAAAPVRNDTGDIIAFLGLRIRPELDFTRILSIARAGDSGETYAFDKNGLLLSASRFDEDLKQIGLLVDSDEVHSILNLQIRDPQVNMVEGKRPSLRRNEQPLTRMTADAVQGNSGVDVDGYRDYRGAPVIGAWTWLPEYDFGITTEVDVAEAYRPLYILRYVFWSLFALLGAAAVAIFVFTVIVSRMDRTARQAVLKAKRLGQYTLDEEIGAGGMGMVYRGHHAMLRRPTAIKLLDVAKTTPETIARFEREVQLTSQLAHPNTIAVYDYGRTPEGVFYYAMEYLDGINLDDLVMRYGPQPEGRIISLLKQVCGSLIEAHGIGLIHRDIKPANIIVSRRGGMADVVKLLDFGLVKALDSGKQAALTAADSLTGTPLYLSPEAVEHPDSVDARSDLYALGAVGYYLLTGSPVFDGASVVEICMQQVNAPPVRPSERLGRPISKDLESVLLACLEKNPDNRPQTARDLSKILQACTTADDWSEDDAESWWNAHGGGQTIFTEQFGAQSATSRPTEETLIVSNPPDEAESFGD